MAWLRKHGWLLLWSVLAAVVVVRATSRPGHRGVILDHVEFGRRLLAGEELYGPWRTRDDAELRPLHPPYPPSYALMTLPYALAAGALGTPAARALWALTQVLALVALAVVLRRLPTGRGPPRRFPLLYLLTLLVAARFVLRDTHGGGGNLINVALCALSWWLAESGRQAGAGWLLGLSLATKPTQLWLLPVFLLLGHRRAAAHAAAAGLACVLASLLLLGFDPAPWLRWLEGSWALATQQDAFATPRLGFPDFEWMNQSLRCAVARWFGEVPADLAARVPGGIRPGLGLATATVAWITRALSLLLLGWLLLAAARRPAGAARTWLLAAALTLSVLLSPLSWKAHHVALLPLLFLLVRAAVERRAPAAIAALVLFVPCCAIGGEVLGDATAEWVNSLYLVTAADLVLAGLALWCASRGAAGADASAAQDPPPPRTAPADAP